jgi:pimeloyl-ACP methyl ester carboxylesterase
MPQHRILAAAALALASCSSAALVTRPAAPAREELKLEVPAGGTDPAATLACELALPSAPAARPVPALLLLRGTGPSSRDYNDGPIARDLQRLLALRLGEAGYAVLRCDARGTGGSTGRFWDGTFDTYLRDAAAQVELLARRPEVDARRIGIVGHSEGGIVAEAVAGKDPRVRALALLAAGGDAFRGAVIAQKAGEARRAGLSAEQVAGTEAAVAAVLDAIAGGSALPPLPPEMAAQVAQMRPWLASRLRHDTRAQTRALPAIPVLVAQGGADWETPPGDADLLLHDLGERRGGTATLRRYPGLNHQFAAAAVEGHDLPGAPIEPRVLEDLAAFLGGAL